MKKKILESDLSEPVERFFVKQGYKINSEVNGCDITAVKDDEIVIIELKLNMNLTLLYQGLERQKIADKVYLAIERPKRMDLKKIAKMKNITSRLNLGLILVGLDSPTKRIDILVEPFSEKKKTSKKQKSLLKEIEGRSQNLNVGGINRNKIMTAYKESAVKILCAMEIESPISSKDLIEKYNCPETSYRVIYGNKTGWFEKYDKGLFAMSERGVLALEEEFYREIVEYYRNEYKKAGFDIKS